MSDDGKNNEQELNPDKNKPEDSKPSDAYDMFDSKESDTLSFDKEELSGTSGSDEDVGGEGKKKSSMPFLDHVEELRWRLIKSLAAIVVLAVISFAFADYVFQFLTMPLGDVKLHFTEITGSFYAYLKVSFFTGIFLALPIVFYQLWKFIGPGLYDREKRMVTPMAFFSTLLFLGGASFCFFVVLPFALQFLISYGEEVMNPIITVTSYISFSSLLIISFGLAFQLPVLGYFLGKVGFVSARVLAKARPYAIVIFLIGSAILTPPDVFTQVLLSGPLYLLYEVTILIVKITQRKDKT
jgi:sec-independent protein translocase protein TatC